MLLAKVTGTVVASQKDARLNGLKMLVLSPTDVQGEPQKGLPVVAVDAIGAGLGDVVLYASGSSARQTEVTKDKPVDAVVMAIVDLVERNGEITYRK